MEKCKYCNEELPEGSTVCPACGKDNAEAPVVETTEEEVKMAAEETAAPVEEAPAEEAAPAEEKPAEKKPTPGKIALAVGAVVVLLAVLIALIAAGVKGNTAPAETLPGEETVKTEETVPATVPEDGNPDDATCKGTYTVTDEESRAAKDTVIATIGDAQLTNGLLQVHYWSAVNSFLNSQQGYYVMMSGGIDPTQPLDTQRCTVEEPLTWQQHFLRQALSNWQTSCALSNEAKLAGVEMSQEAQEFLNGMEEYLAQTAASNGMTVDDLLLRNVGPGAGLEEFTQFQKMFSEGRGYYADQVSKMVPTDEELEAFFTAHEEAYAAGGITREGKFVDVRHILVMPKAEIDEDGPLSTEFTEEQWKACEEEAQSILLEWQTTGHNEDRFAELANQKSEDPGSNTNGGLYENVFMGQMVKPFEDWCFDETRKPGDTGIVETEYGYHIMYFVGSADQWRYYAESDWLTDQTNKFFEGLAEAYPMEVDYSKVMLGYLNMAQ